VSHEQIQVPDIERERASDQSVPRFSKQLGRRQIGFLNSPAPIEADIRNGSEIVKIDKPLNSGFEFILRIALQGGAHPMNRRAVFIHVYYRAIIREFLQRAGRSFRLRVTRLTETPECNCFAFPSRLCALLAISATTHLFDFFCLRQLLFLRRYPPV